MLLPRSCDNFSQIFYVLLPHRGCPNQELLTLAAEGDQSSHQQLPLCSTLGAYCPPHGVTLLSPYSLLNMPQVTSLYSHQTTLRLSLIILPVNAPSFFRLFQTFLTSAAIHTDKGWGDLWQFTWDGCAGRISRKRDKRINKILPFLTIVSS